MRNVTSRELLHRCTYDQPIIGMLVIQTLESMIIWRPCRLLLGPPMPGDARICQEPTYYQVQSARRSHKREIA